MDEIDIAQKENERHLARLLKKIDPNTKVAATGYCLNCDKSMPNIKRRWCDADCRDDWQKRNNKKAEGQAAEKAQRLYAVENNNE